MLDLSDLMTDPDFASRMVLERTEIARREFGRPVYETKQIEITGVIQPASAEDLQPLADGANGYVTEGLVLYTDFVVTAAPTASGPTASSLRASATTSCRSRTGCPTAPTAGRF